MTTEFRPVAGGHPGPDTEQPDVELRMRRALGLRPANTGSPKEVQQRRTDGGPIVAERALPERGPRNFEPMVNRVAQAETALANERRLREQAERGLRDAQAALHESETRRGHAEMAREEAVSAVAAERAARAAADAAKQAAEAAQKVAEEARAAALDALAVAEEALAAAEDKVKKAMTAKIAAEKSVAAPVVEKSVPVPVAAAKVIDTPEATIAAPKKRGRPAKVVKPQAEPEETAPVEWWVPGWRSRV